MDFWIKLGIGAIVAVFWIAGNIREKQRAAAAAAPPPLPLADPGVNAPARPTDDVQEFLKQIRGRIAEPVRKETPLQAVLVDEPRREKRPTPAAPRPQKKPKKQEADTAPNLSKRRAEVTSLVPDAVPLTAALSSDPAPMVSVSRGASPAAREMKKLLRSPSGLATAFLLKEIMDGPVSRKRRGRR